MWYIFQEEDALDGENTPHSISLPSITHHSIMYAPKCLVLVSRLDYIETFRVCISVNILKLLFLILLASVG